MKKIFLMILILLMSVMGMTATNDGKVKYEVKGKAPATYNGRQVMIYTQSFTGVDRIDSTVVKKGKFRMKGTIEKPVVAMFSIRTDKPKVNLVALDGTPVKIAVKGDEMAIVGGANNARLREYEETVDKPLHESVAKRKELFDQLEDKTLSAERRAELEKQAADMGVRQC